MLAADGLFDQDGRFHCMPAESAAQVAELFRHRFLHALREAKLISAAKLTDLLSWKHSGFHVDHGPKPVAPHDIAGRKHLAEYLLRMPFSLQKIHWNETSNSVIYRSRKHWRTKRNFEVFPVSDFLAAAVQHIPPKGQQTVRYYGLYSNKSRGIADTDRPMLIPAPAPVPLDQQAPADEILPVPPPLKQTARALRPLWRDLILRVWGGDPLRCPCCKSTMKVAGTLQRPEEIEFFLRLHGLWEGVITLPRPPPPPFDVESMELIRPPWRALKEWIPVDDTEDDPGWLDQSNP